MRILVLALAACGGGAVVTAVAPPPGNTAPVRRPGALEPVVISPAANTACPLQWNVLDEIAPARIAFRTGDAATDEECPNVDPMLANPDDECVDCTNEGRVASGAHVKHEVSGPGGSGRYWHWRIDVGERFVCGTGSSVGWRHVMGTGEMRTAEMIAPLKWFVDVDGDGTYEVVVWHRLPWGSSEITNGLMPVVYAVNANELVRRDDFAKPLRTKVAAMYRALAKQTKKSSVMHEFVGCYEAIATALD